MCYVQGHYSNYGDMLLSVLEWITFIKTQEEKHITLTHFQEY